MEKDLVCGMEIDEQKAAASHQYGGRSYHFCSEACRDEFTRNPEKFVK
jgi:YHS domain-containing protein